MEYFVGQEKRRKKFLSKVRLLGLIPRLGPINQQIPGCSEENLFIERI